MTKSAIIAAAMLVMVTGCSKKADESASTSAATTPAPGGEKSAAVSGVPECDEYLTKVMACIKDKIPAAQRGAMEQAIEQSKASWAAVADKTQLAATCKSALDQAKASYGAMGCSF